MRQTPLTEIDDFREADRDQGGEKDWDYDRLSQVQDDQEHPKRCHANHGMQTSTTLAPALALARSAGFLPYSILPISS
jgi:hypothetical protein